MLTSSQYFNCQPQVTVAESVCCYSRSESSDTCLIFRVSSTLIIKSVFIIYKMNKIWRRDEMPMNQVRFWAAAEDSFLHLSVQTGPRISSASYSVSIWGFSPEIEQLRNEGDHSSQCTAEVRNVWSITSSPPMSIMECCFIKHMNNITVLLL